MALATVISISHRSEPAWIDAFARHGCLAAALALCLSSPARADDLPRFSVASFGTVGAVYHDQSSILYRRDLTQVDGAQAGSVDFGVDSRFGVQFNARFSNHWEAFLQVQSRHESDRDWTPQLTSAALHYRPTNWLALRAGRLNIDIYPGAESRDVGYAILPVRPPVEVFGVLLARSVDGGDLALSHHWGEGFLEFRLQAGELLGEIRSGGVSFDLGGSRMYSGNVSFSQNDWSVQTGASWHTMAHERPTEALQQALFAIATPSTIRIANALRSKDRTFNYYYLGASYSPGPLRMQTVLSRIATREPSFDEADAGMLIAGYRVGSFTPYIAFSAVWGERTLLGTGLPDALGPQIAQLNAAVEVTQRELWGNQQTAAAGVRWDLHTKFALKFQVDCVHVKDASIVTDMRPRGSGHQTFATASVALDFVF